MIQILNPNKQKLMDRIAQCRGKVYLNLSDGTACDLKHDPVALGLLQTLEIPKTGICLTLSDPQDVRGFVRYLMEVSADAG